MDYDKTTIAARYDAGRSYSRRVLSHWMGVVARAAGDRVIKDILDLGCGTGRYSNGLAETFGVAVIAVDPSRSMLSEARKKPGKRVRWLQASAEALPIPDRSVDMVFISMAYHHFSDPMRAIRECRRVLRTSGIVCLRAGTTERIPTYPYVPFFKRSASILEGVLQPRRVIESAFRKGGFRLLRYEAIASEVAANLSAYADKLAYRADSILAQLNDDEFEEGLANLRAYAARTKAHAATEMIDFFVFH